MKRLLHKILCSILIVAGLSGCHYLNIVPDYTPVLDNAFALRSEAKKYLYTCYSYLPNPGSIGSSPSFLRGELWPLSAYKGNSSYFVRDQQNVVDPYLNYWEGRNSGVDLWEGVRDCNIFLSHINTVPNMEETEKEQWAAEVKFLKAYYLFYLVRMYGPIPLMEKTYPVEVSLSKVQQHRKPVDTCFNHIVDLIDQAIPNLPDHPFANINEPHYGRINQPIAKSIKALILVTAASPLFNGNTDYANYVDKKYGVLFNQKYSKKKWEKAKKAAKEAITTCEADGYHLFTYQQSIGQDLTDTTMTKLSIRQAFAKRGKNPEVIWPYTGSFATQTNLTPRSWDPDRIITSMQGRYAPSLDIVDLFYTENGLPIDEDKDWDYNHRMDLDTAKEANKYNIDKGYVTVGLHFHRGSRFYASTGFDGGIWYGQGKYDDENTWHIEGRAGGYTAAHSSGSYSPTSYWPKKNVNFRNVVEANRYDVNSYLFPFMRLSGLYLLYAEAANEADGPSNEIYGYLNQIRDRAGLPTVQDAWDNHADHPNKYKDKNGLREIIYREREIELIYESKRYWDLLRWKTAQNVLSKPVRGWNLVQENPKDFYKPVVLFQRKFMKRDYFFPIRELELERNPNLLQSPFW